MEPNDYKKFLSDLKEFTSNDFLCNYIAYLASSCGVLFMLTFFDFLQEYRYYFLTFFIVGILAVTIIKLKTARSRKFIRRCYTINLKDEVNYENLSNFFINNEKFKRFNLYPFGSSYYYGPFDFIWKREKAPKINVPINLPQNGHFPEVIKYKSCYFYLNIYHFSEQNFFTMDGYKQKHDDIRKEIDKRYPKYGRFILDVIIVNEMTDEMQNYVKEYINPRLSEASIFMILCGKEAYIPPIDLINAKTYQKNFYKKVLLYFVKLLNPINYVDTFPEKDLENNIEIYKIK